MAYREELFDIVWDDRRRESFARRETPRPRQRTPGAKHAGGHRSRVTPVPIPNTEVKLATADGTAWETVWESRSLPAVIPRKPDVRDHVGLSPFQRAALRLPHSFHASAASCEKGPAKVPHGKRVRASRSLTHLDRWQTFVLFICFNPEGPRDEPNARRRPGAAGGRRRGGVLPRARTARGPRPGRPRDEHTRE